MGRLVVMGEVFELESNPLVMFPGTEREFCETFGGDEER